MPLRDLDLSPSDDPIPADVSRFIREADRRIEIFQDACRVPGFVPSDYSAAYRVLRGVVESGLPRGRQFCEWGSGFGVIACLAAMLDFDSCGVEVESIKLDERGVEGNGHAMMLERNNAEALEPVLGWVEQTVGG